MNLQIEPNGALTFILEEGERDDIQNMIDNARNDLDHEVLYNMLDMYGYLGNAVLTPIKPEDVGALTDAPMLSDDVEHGEDGERLVRGQVWWFPNYAIESFAHTLMKAGSVTFALGSKQLEPA